MLVIMHSSKRDTAVAGRRTSRMKELTNRNYLEHINEKSGISILEFYSPSCTHCKKMEHLLSWKKLRKWMPLLLNVIQQMKGHWHLDMISVQFLQLSY